MCSSKNFSKEELECSCGCEETIDPILLITLQKLRDIVDKPFTINSAKRCIDWNISVGGSTNSWHTKGLAVDISIINWESKAVELLVRSAKALGFKGIGYYKTFIHLDLRDDVTTWNG